MCKFSKKIVEVREVGWQKETVEVNFSGRFYIMQTGTGQHPTLTRWLTKYQSGNLLAIMRFRCCSRRAS